KPCALPGHPGAPSRHLEVAAEGLLALDRLEQRFEVPFPEAACAVALYHLEEQRGPVLCGLCKDLQQIAVVVPVDENPQPLESVRILADLSDAFGGILVVGLRRREEEYAELLQRLDGAHDVLRLQRHVLD